MLRRRCSSVGFRYPPGFLCISRYSISFLINLLKQPLALAPALNILELRYLDDATWALTVHRATLDTEEDVREARLSLRSRAKSSFEPHLRKALQMFAQANQGSLLAEVSQLKP